MTPWIAAQQDPLSMGFPSQEYWSGLAFPSPADLPYPGLKLAGIFFTAEPLGKPQGETVLIPIMGFGVR